ncbi:SEC-C domain-containing protein [Acidothermaceae bacterium B102]|nr:SEC-C domain-containing protein [Acidothermaceae bacterium B102]
MASLTSDDLDALGQTEGSSEDLLATVARLVRAVEQDRIADHADIGYALSVAADLSRVAGDRAGAIELAERAIAANLVHGDGSADFARALLAELLFEDGLETEAFAQLEPLRALMTVDTQAGRMVAEALQMSGRSELALEWLTEAVVTAVAMGEAIPEDKQEALERMTAVVYELVITRHGLRETMGLDHDEYDLLADSLQAEIDALNHPGPLLFWPSAEFAALLARWPGQAEAWGADWDEHRAELEAELQGWSESGTPGLSLLAGSLAELDAFATAQGDDAADEDVQLDYADALPDERELSWPPPRNGPCWCGSGAKYKKCCLVRTR